MEDIQTKCKYIQFTLLDLLRTPAMATYYIRELEHSKACDHFYSQEKLRACVRKELGTSKIKRIVDFTHSDSDELRAIKLLLWRGDDYRQQILKHLSWSERLHYIIWKV